MGKPIHIPVRSTEGEDIYSSSAKLKPQDYTVVWKFKDDDYMKVDFIKATTAPRAISKLVKALSEEYAYDKRDLIISEVYIGSP